MNFNIIRKKGLAVLLGAMLILPGCKKFLEEKDPSNLTPESFYTIPEHAEAAIASVYSNHQTYSKYMS